MTDLESQAQAYLFKLRQSVGVKSLIERQWSRQDWQSVGQGFDAVEARSNSPAGVRPGASSCCAGRCGTV
jgi:hypothetical protein